MQNEPKKFELPFCTGCGILSYGSALFETMKIYPTYCALLVKRAALAQLHNMNNHIVYSYLGMDSSILQ